MVFGEPDVEVKKQKDGPIMVADKGVDVYDPTTGQIRSASTDDIACWFIDSNYNWRELLRTTSPTSQGPKNCRPAPTDATGGDRQIRLEPFVQHR